MEPEGKMSVWKNKIENKLTTSTEHIRSTGKTIAIVTGASSGLGREFVKLVDKKETYDEIWVIARRESLLNKIADQIETNVRVIPIDLRLPESIYRIRDMLHNENPEVRLLICSAGLGKIGNYEQISLDDQNAMIDLNCRAAVDVTQTVIPFMPRGARIMEICSTAGFQPFQYLSVYAASKAFIYRYSRALRIELLPKRISVTAVCPYWVRDTEFIPIARETAEHNPIRHFPLSSKQENVARRAYRDANLRLPVSLPSAVAVVHRIFAKIIPSELMMGIWAIIRRL